MRPSRDSLGSGSGFSSRDSFGLSIGVVRPSNTPFSSALTSGYSSLNASDRPGRAHLQTSTFSNALGGGGSLGAGGLSGSALLSGPSVTSKPRLDRPLSSSTSTQPTSAAGKYHFSTPYSSQSNNAAAASSAASPAASRRTPSLSSTSTASLGSHARGRSVGGYGFSLAEEDPSMYGSSLAAAALAYPQAQTFAATSTAALSYPHAQTFAASSGAYGSSNPSGIIQKDASMRRIHPTTVAHGPHQIVSAIREQLHNLQVAASTFSAATTHAAGSLAATRSSSVSAPVQSSTYLSASPPLPAANRLSASPSPSPSDGGSDDDLVDMSPPPSTAAANGGRPTSAVSAHLAERILGAPQQQRVGVKTGWSEPAAAAASGTKPQPSPPSTASIANASPPPSASGSPSGSPVRNNTKKVASSTATAQAQNSGRASSAAQSGRASIASSSKLPSSSSTLITIHVCDESRGGLVQDFQCDRTLLITGMEYFKAYLGNGSTGAGGGDEVDISVHCDVHIFQYLLSYITWEASVGKLPVQKDAIKSSTGVPPVKPPLDPSNVISILISSDFLMMSGLVRECVRFLREELAGMMKTHSHIDLTCLNDQLVEKLAAEFVDAEDCFSDSERNGIDPPPTSGSSSASSGTRDLMKCSSLDKKGALTPRLWRYKLQAMINSRMAVGGGEELRECLQCGGKWWARKDGGNSSSSADENASSSSSSCPVSSSLRLLSFHGVLSSPHSPSASWSLSKCLLAWRVQRKEWKETWWTVWAWCHGMPSECTQCGLPAGAMYAELDQCRYHEREPIWIKSGAGQSQLMHTCCQQPAMPFSSTAGGGNGCKRRMHLITPQTQREKAIHETALRYIDLITTKEDTSNADPIVPMGSQSVPSKRRSISFLSGLASGPTPSGNASAKAHQSSAAGFVKRGSHSSIRQNCHRHARGSESESDRDRGHSTDASGPDNDGGESGEERSESRSGGEEEDWEDDEDEDEQFEDEDEDSDGGSQRFTPLTPAQKAAAQAERLKFRKGYEGRNPHGHAAVKKKPRTERQSSTLAGASSASHASGAARPGSSVNVTVRKLDPLVEQALKQLRDVLPPEEFATLAANMAPATGAANRGSVSSAGAASTTALGGKQRAASASAIRVATGGRRGTITGGSGNPAIKVTTNIPTSSSAAIKPKSILKNSPTNASTAGGLSEMASITLSELSSVWGATPTPTNAQQQQQRSSPDASPTRSPSSSFHPYSNILPPSEKKKKASYQQLDSLLEDDRQRMASLVTNLTQSRAAPAPPPAQPTSSHGRSASTSSAPPPRRGVPVERVQSAQVRRPSMR